MWEASLFFDIALANALNADLQEKQVENKN